MFFLKSQNLDRLALTLLKLFFNMGPLRLRIQIMTVLSRLMAKGQNHFLITFFQRWTPPLLKNLFILIGPDSHGRSVVLQFLLFFCSLTIGYSDVSLQAAFILPFLDTLYWLSLFHIFIFYVISFAWLVLWLITFRTMLSLSWGSGFA